MADKETVFETELMSEPKALFTGRMPAKAIVVEVETGTGILTRGTIVAADDGTGKIKEFKPTGSGGEEKARYILASETLDLANDKYASVYDCGDFYYGGIIFPTEMDKAKTEKAIKELESHKIYITEGDSKCPTA